MTISDEDRKELERLCRAVEKYARAVEKRDRFMTQLYDSYRADPADLQRVSKLKSAAQLYGAFHRYGSERVRLRAYRPAVRDRQRDEEDA